MHNAPQSGAFEIAVDDKVDEIVQAQDVRLMRHKTRGSKSGKFLPMRKERADWRGSKRERHVRSTAPVHDSNSQRVLQTFRDVHAAVSHGSCCVPLARALLGHTSWSKMCQDMQIAIR